MPLELFETLMLVDQGQIRDGKQAMSAPRREAWTYLWPQRRRRGGDHQAVVMGQTDRPDAGVRVVDAVRIMMTDTAWSILLQVGTSR